jgi:hypothetical protein
MVAEKTYFGRDKPEKRQFCLITLVVTLVPMKKYRRIAARMLILLLMPPEREKHRERSSTFPLVIIKKEMVELDTLLLVPAEADERIEGPVFPVTPPLQPAVKRPQMERVPARLLVMIIG